MFHTREQEAAKEEEKRQRETRHSFLKFPAPIIFFVTKAIVIAQHYLQNPVCIKKGAMGFQIVRMGLKSVHPK